MCYQPFDYQLHKKIYDLMTLNFMKLGENISDKQVKNVQRVENIQYVPVEFFPGRGWSMSV